MPHLQKFSMKTFTDGPQNMKLVKVFTLKSILQQDMYAQHNVYLSVTCGVNMFSIHMCSLQAT